jgi:hypothetical protein
MRFSPCMSSGLIWPPAGFFVISSVVLLQSNTWGSPKFSRFSVAKYLAAWLPSCLEITAPNPFYVPWTGRSTSESSAMLYLLIILKTGFDGWLWTLGFWISSWWVDFSSLCKQNIRGIDVTYESIVRNKSVSVLLWSPVDSSKRFWDSTGCQAVKVCLFFTFL